MAPLAFADVSPNLAGLRRITAHRKNLCVRRAPTPSLRTTPRAQTWSDPAVTQEYVDFLEGKGGKPASTDGPSVIIGSSGRLGDLFAGAGDENDIYIKRGEAIPADAKGPVYVCTPAAAVEEVIMNCPEEKVEDLVFMSNGYLETVLRRHGCDDNTRLAAYFAVPKLGSEPIDGVSTMHPKGLTCAVGKWGDAVEQRLAKVRHFALTTTIATSSQHGGPCLVQRLSSSLTILGYFFFLLLPFCPSTGRSAVQGFV